jgi:hypothetical protein
VHGDEGEEFKEDMEFREKRKNGGLRSQGVLRRTFLK